jgi:hypothetical protein
MHSRCLVSGLAVACAALALPSLAAAKDFCVNAPAGCAGTPVDSAGLSAALTGAQANGTADRFFLAPGTYAAAAFAYQSPEPVQVIGAGADRTVLTGTSGSVLTLGGDESSEVSGVTLRPAAGAGSGLKLVGARATGVVVDGTASPSMGAGVLLYGDSAFERGEVDLNAVDGPAVLVFSGNASVSDATLSAPGGYGVAAAGGDVTVRRSTLVAPRGALATTGHLVVEDTLIDLRGHKPGTPSVGVAASTSFGGGFAAAADVERVTIAGATADTIGVQAEATDPGRSATVALRDSVITGVGVPISREAGSGATASVSTDHSAYPGPVDPSHDSGAGSLVEQARIAADPHFVDAPYGDFHLAAGSPLIDAGTPGPLPAGTTDRDGAPRPADGNGDCTAATDIGAFEFAGAPCTPAPVAVPAASAPAAPPRPVVSRLRVARGTVSFRLSEAATVRLRFTRRGHRAITRRVAARAGANRVRIALRRGRYRLTLVAVDRAGARSRPATVRFTLTPPRLGAP